MPFSLYIVATPVGNLEDITFRAVRVLKEAKAVACEDTRVTAKLFARYRIGSRLISCREHNEAKQAENIIRILKEEGDVALVTDAGTPMLSDPGMRVVRRAAEEGFAVVPVPGASALLCALCAGAVPFEDFTFLGFLPRRKGKAEKVLSEFVSSPRAVVIYESPKRTVATLALILEILGDREAAVCREMTKMHEETLRGKVSFLSQNFAERETVKGEVVIVVSGAEQTGPDERETEKLLRKLKKDGVSFKDAVKMAIDETGAAKNPVYFSALRVWGKNGSR